MSLLVVIFVLIMGITFVSKHVPVIGAIVLSVSSLYIRNIDSVTVLYSLESTAQ